MNFKVHLITQTLFNNLYKLFNFIIPQIIKKKRFSFDFDGASVFLDKLLLLASSLSTTFCKITITTA